MASCPPTAMKRLSICHGLYAVSSFTYAIRPLLPDGHSVLGAIERKSSTKFSEIMLATCFLYTQQA